MSRQYSQENNGHLPLPNERMNNLVKIQDILEGTPDMPPATYIQVKVLWVSKRNTFSQRRFNTESPGRSSFHSYRFMFSDDTGVIQAVLKFSDHEDYNFNSENVRNLLKKYSIVKISGFTVEDFEYDPRFPNYEDGTSLINDHLKRIKLSNSTMDIVSVMNCNSFYKQMPFQFVQLRDIDNYSEGSKIDLIGFVNRVTEIRGSNNRTTMYQWVFVTSCHDPDNSFTRKISLFGDHLNSVQEGCVYAFTNLLVQNFDGNRSLQTCYKSIAMKIDSINFAQDIPLEYHGANFVTDVFPQRENGHRQPNVPLTPIINPESPRPLSPATSIATTIPVNLDSVFGSPVGTPNNTETEEETLVPAPGNPRRRRGSFSSSISNSSALTEVLMDPPARRQRFN